MIILASQSAIRSQLLTQAGVAHLVRPSRFDETAVQSSSLQRSPADLASHLSQAKATTVTLEFPNDLIIGADQTLEFEGQSLHKCRDLIAAKQLLQTLSGKSHHLHSAVTVMKANEVLFQFTGHATLTMRQLTPEFIDHYLELTGDDVLSSVGCYKLEAQGSQLFKNIEGDYFTILGLPLLPLLAFFREIGELPT
jgi:septum formation protein